MRTLSLYIDRWYIAAAVGSDGIPHRIALPNHEDRIWLYFYEDTNNNCIIYGKAYQLHFLNKEAHYYGDIFSLIVKDNESFIRFDHKVNIKEIFKAADILDHLKKDFSKEQKVTTYVSFSTDISYAAQKVFLDILAKNDFVVKESVARISHLALEFSKRQGKLENSKCILVLCACNDNLKYTVYKTTNSFYVRQGQEGSLVGYGTDLRGYALLKQIITEINKSSKFLQKEEEEFEIMRLSQNLERWLLQMDNTKFGRPVVYNDITFSRAPHNMQRVTVLKSTIEERTQSIVSYVVEEIFQYVKNIEIHPTNITHIVFIGDSFRNTMFKEALLQRYIVKEENIINYQNKDLPEIVNVYTQMDLTQFDKFRPDVEKLSKEQLEQIRIAEEERRERERATQLQEEREQAYAAAQEIEKKYLAAMQDADSYEKKGDYSSMIDLLKIALQHKPDDKEAAQLLEKANLKLSEVKIKSEQYNKIIRLAQEAFKAKLWAEAKTKSEAALDLREDSLEAKRILKEAKREIALAQSVKEFILRADTFIGKKLYDEALEELYKAKHADTNNEGITKRINKIEKIQSEYKLEIDKLEQSVLEAEQKKEYANAIEFCKKLIDKDTANQRKWNEHIVKLRTEWDSLKRMTEQYEKLQNQINDAYFNEEWETLIKLCKESLKIQEDETIRKCLNKSEEKFKYITIQKTLEQTISKIKALIADKQWEEAREETKLLQKQNVGQSQLVKQLFKQIFDAEEAWAEKRNNSPQNTQQLNTERPIIRGFSPDRNDDFFEEPKSNSYPKVASGPKNKPHLHRHKKERDDFFDLDFGNTSQCNPKANDERGEITINDFDF